MISAVRVILNIDIQLLFFVRGLIHVHEKVEGLEE